MKKVLFALGLVLNVCANAQINDSINIPDLKGSEVLELHFMENPVQNADLKIKDYTQTSVYANFTDAELKRVQTPEKTSSFSFNTKGIYNISPKIRAYGEFNYDFLNEEKMGYNLSNRRTDHDFVLNPNYLFVPKSSDWENQKYTVKVGGYYNEKNFTFGLTAEYKNQSSFRISDPRPAISLADYSGNLFAGYRFGKHQISVTGGVGRKTENNDVISVNQYINAPANSEYFVRFSNGYGRVIYFPSFREFIYRTNSHNYGAGYSFSTAKTQLNVNYRYHWAMENIYVEDANSNVYIDPNLVSLKYRETTHKISANLQHQSSYGKWFSDFGAELMSGDNFNIQENGQNYRLISDLYFANIRFLGNNSKSKNWGVTLESRLYDFRAKDLLGVSDKKVNALEVDVKVHHDLYKSEKHRINAEIGVLNYVSLETGLIYNAASSDTSFYQNVMLPDQQYDAETKTGFTAELSFYSDFYRNTQLKIFANFASLFATGNILNNIGPKSMFSSGISIYY